MNNQAESVSDDTSPKQPAGPDFYSNMRDIDQPASKIKEPPKPRKTNPVRIKQPPPVTGQIKDLYVDKKFAGKEKRITMLGPNVGGFANPKIKRKKTRKGSPTSKSPRKIAPVGIDSVGVSNRPPSEENRGRGTSVILQD